MESKDGRIEEKKGWELAWTMGKDSNGNMTDKKRDKDGGGGSVIEKSVWEENRKINQIN